LGAVSAEPGELVSAGTADVLGRRHRRSGVAQLVPRQQGVELQGT
jgi:hypothetical protein